MKAGVFAFLMLGVLAAALRAEVEFAGYLQVAGRTKFVLADAAEAKVSDWLEIGETFAGHTVTAFDARAETLTLTKEGRPTRLTLKSATIRPTVTAGTGAGADAILPEEMQESRRLLAAVETERSALIAEFEEGYPRLGSSGEKIAAREQLSRAMMASVVRRALLRELIQAQTELYQLVEKHDAQDWIVHGARVKIAELRGKLATGKP